MVDAIPETGYRKDVFLPDAPNSNTSAANGNGGGRNTNPLYETEEEFDAAIAELKARMAWFPDTIHIRTCILS